MLLLGFKGFLGFDLLSVQNNFKFAYKKHVDIFSTISMIS
jgi:hypothetical protein